MSVSEGQLRSGGFEGKAREARLRWFGHWMLNIELTGRGKEKNTESIHRCSEGWCNKRGS